MKISIIGGGGLVGSTAAFVLAQKNILDEICLVDIRENVAKSHEMDMDQAVSFLTKTKITSGSWEKLEGSDIVIIAVGRSGTGQKVSSRMEHLKDNIKIISKVSNYIKKYASTSIIINATNPMDVINSLLQQLTGFDRKKLIGFSLNDTLRFRWALAEVLNKDIHSIQAMVLGEHGELQCPICSNIYVDGNRIELSPEQKSQVLNKIHHFFYEYASLDSGRTSGWLSSIGLTILVEAIIKNTEEVLPCSVIDEEGISIGLPVTLNQKGIERVMPINIEYEEQRQLDRARRKVANILNELKI